MTDLELLQLYVRNQDQRALTQLVERHLDWVRSAAIRRVRDVHLAEDVTQAVFLTLARKTPRLKEGVPLSAWIFKVVRYAAATALRTEANRKRHERQAATMILEARENIDKDQWEKIAPVLDELVAKLPTTDQTAILLRFYEQRSWQEVGQVLAVSEEAARKRVSRAVERLRTMFESKQLLLGSGALSAGLLLYTTHAAPPAKAGAVASAATAAGASARSILISKGIMSNMKWASAKIAAMIAAMIFLMSGVGVAVVSGIVKHDVPAPAPAAVRLNNPSATQPSKIGNTWTNSLKMTFASIPSGTFLMGSPQDQSERSDDETQHKVTLTKQFLIGTTHVTVGQFASFAKDSAYRTDAEKDGKALVWTGKKMEMVNGASWRKPGFDQGDDRPAVEISWNDAVAFCDWLSKKEGKRYRLPTEAQWEYACRAGTNTAYPWGDNPNNGKGWANCADLTLKKAIPNYPGQFFNWEDGFIYTSPVGKYKVNAWGLYDMIGNAWEWCSDYYGKYPEGDVTDPQGPATDEAQQFDLPKEESTRDRFALCAVGPGAASRFTVTAPTALTKCQATGPASSDSAS